MGDRGAGLVELTRAEAQACPCPVPAALVERGVRIRDGAGDLAVSFAGPSEENVPALKRLNAVIFPTRYSDVVYRQVQLCGDVTQLAYAGGELIGAVACRVEAVLGRPGGPGGRLYVITVGVLAEHRSRGLGSLLLQRSLALASETEGVTEAYLHVQAGNEEALGFYKRMGFAVAGTTEGYYARSRGVVGSADALVLSQPLAPRGRFPRAPCPGCGEGGG